MAWQRSNGVKWQGIRQVSHDRLVSASHWGSSDPAAVRLLSPPASHSLFLSFSVRVSAIVNLITVGHRILAVSAGIPVVKKGVECYQELGVPPGKLVLAFPWYNRTPLW